ncbi:MAG: flagellar protein FlaG [Thiohalomonadaceae bacterium]
MPTEIGSNYPVGAPVLSTLGTPKSRSVEQPSVPLFPQQTTGQEAHGETRSERPEREVDLGKAVAEVAQYVRRDLNFSLDEESGRTVVKIIDAQSNEVVRQIPSEEMLALARHLARLAEEDRVSGEQAKGLLLTAKV